MYSAEFLNTLVTGVIPALGCTEPVAVGLGVAKAMDNLKGEIESINVKVSANIYKNGMGVGIPGTKEIGLVFASALAAVCGDSALGLEVFKNVNDESVKIAEQLIKDKKVNVELEENQGNFIIISEIKTTEGFGKSIIKNSHTNIVYHETNEEVLLDELHIVEDTKVKKEKNAYLKEVKISDIIRYIENVDFEDIKFLLNGIDVNMEIAQVGLEQKPGAALGAATKALMDRNVISADLSNKAKMYAAAACDARMAGINMPVMSSDGSGNQGIMAIVPVAVVAKEEGYNDDKTARAIALSHLVTAYIKVFNGNLSPVCGCAIAAGIGSSAAITWAMGGNDEQVGIAIKNIIGTLSGLVCDGAKGGCAFKIATATTESITQAILALENIEVNPTDGILAPTVEQSIRNLGEFSKKGMLNADKEIINIMEATLSSLN